MSDNKVILKTKGNDGFGNYNEYEFVEIDAITGLTIAHDYGSMLVNVLPQIAELFAKFAELPDPEGGAEDTRFEDLVIGEMAKLGDSPVLGLIKFIPSVLTSQRVVALCKLLLAGAKVNGEECDASGMCSVFKGRPQKVYAALFWAVLMNYPDLRPLLGALDKEGDTTDSQ